MAYTQYCKLVNENAVEPVGAAKLNLDKCFFYNATKQDLAKKQSETENIINFVLRIR